MLIILVILLVAVRIALPYVVKPSILQDERVAQLEMAMKNAQEAQEEEEPSGYAAERFELPTTKPFPFDPNTIDSAQALALGLRPKTVGKLLNWRRKGKVFYRPEQFKDVWTLRPEEYERLRPFIAIAEKDKPWAKGRSNYRKWEDNPLPEHIDINKADAATLIRLRGIGATLADKIIARRELLGGYMQVSQIMEVYRFADSTYSMLQEKLVATPEGVKKMVLNEVSEEKLARHPYIGAKMAKNIVLYRTGLRGFTQVTQLRQVPLMNEENYRKIAPYFVIQ